jgi:hypothetical protein
VPGGHQSKIVKTRRDSAEVHAVQECACSVDGKQAGKEDQQ